MISRRLQQQALRFADQSSDRVRKVKPQRRFKATVTSISPGGASDGNALVSISWRGQQVTVAGYSANYTPGAGHRVVCDVIDDQVFIAYRIVGTP